MWCDIKNTQYGKNLSSQIGDKNAKQFAMGIAQPKFTEWFGKGKTVKLENNEIAPFINPIMQVINEKGEAYNILERFKFETMDQAQGFFNNNQVGIIKKGDLYQIPNTNRVISNRLLDEFDRIYPGLLARQGDTFTVNNNYSFTEPYYAKNEDLITEAKNLSKDIKGIYSVLAQENIDQVLFEASSQANHATEDPTEIEGKLTKLNKVFGERFIEIARQLYPDIQSGETFESYTKDHIATQYAQVDDKLKTLMDKLSMRFSIPYEIVNKPSLPWKGYYDAHSNRIVINQAKVTGDIPFHEFLHPFILVLEKENPNLYEALTHEFENSEESTSISIEVGRKYPNLDERDAQQESLVTYIGRLAQVKEAKSNTLLGRLLKWLKSLFKKINIDIPNLSLDTTLSEISNYIQDDIYVADLKAAGRNSNSVVKFARTDTELTYQNLYDRVKDRVAILTATVRTRKRGDQFKDDIEALNNIIQNADEITSINNFMSNALTYVDSAYKRFESLRESVKKVNTLSKEDISYNLYVLGEIQQLLNVYDTLDDIKSLFVREGSTSTDDVMANLREAIDKKDLMVEDFRSFALTYLTEWLYPYLEPTNKILESQGAAKEDILTKAQFRDQLKTALRDISAAGYWLGATINSQDPISAAVGLALKDVVYENHMKDIETKNKLTSSYKNVKGTQLYTTKSSEDQFNLQFMKEIEVWEQVGMDDEGEPIYGYVRHLALHEEYNEDQFDKARRDFYASLGIRPNRSDRANYIKYQRSITKWYADNTRVNPNVVNLLVAKKTQLTKRQFEKWILENTKEVDEEIYDSGYKKSDFFRGKIYSYNQARGTFRIYTGELIRPAEKYKNPEFAKMMAQPYYRDLYNTYRSSNEKLGQFGLKVWYDSTNI
jgi:hypothetical protein